MDKRDRARILREYATEELFRWLTEEGRKDRVRDYVEKGAAAALKGRVRLKAASYLPEGEAASLSDNLRGLTATRLSRSFGEDAPSHVYPTEDDGFTWAGHAAFGLGMMVDYFALADRLLRRYVPEYVPSETHPVDLEQPPADPDDEAGA
jgi:hypothetical protein